MTDTTTNLGENQNTPEANVPRFSSEKIKDYGQKSLSPILNVLHKYQGDIGPYFSAFGKALQAGADSLRTPVKAGEISEKNEVNDYVAGLFSDASNWLNQAKSKLEASSPKEILNFVEEETRDRPGLLFGASYVAGLIFGRIGRHIGRQGVKGTSYKAEDKSYGEQQLH